MNGTEGGLYCPQAAHMHPWWPRCAESALLAHRSGCQRKLLVSSYDHEAEGQAPDHATTVTANQSDT